MKFQFREKCVMFFFIYRWGGGYCLWIKYEIFVVSLLVYIWYDDEMYLGELGRLSHKDLYFISAAPQLSGFRLNPL